jgi:DNA repair protein RecO (recombination protein O)
MEWSDEGLVLARRRHGESGAVVTLLTREHGRHLGLARGGGGARAGSVYQLGNRVAVRWRGRLEEHLGSFTCELVEEIAARHLDDATRLDALAAATALLATALPERHPYPQLFIASLALLRGLAERDFAAAYVRWEVELLGELGFGLDLAACAVSGASGDLAFVSPRSGRAVGRAAGRAYAERLLALPDFLARPDRAVSGADVAAGLALTGHFLERYVLEATRRSLPAARSRFVERWSRAARLNSRSPTDS